MPKNKYPEEPDSSAKEPLFPHKFFYGERSSSYGTFGFIPFDYNSDPNNFGSTSGKHEYGYTTSDDTYEGVFIFNEAGCKLITQAFPGFSLGEILYTLNKEFENPLSKGYSHGLCNCVFDGTNFNNIGIFSKRGFGTITNSSPYLEQTQKSYATDVGKDIVDKIFEDLIPYLSRKTEENAHLVQPPSPKGRSNDL